MQECVNKQDKLNPYFFFKRDYKSMKTLVFMLPHLEQTLK